MWHEFGYPAVYETTPAKATPERDTFLDGLTLNHTEIEPYDMDIATYAKNLAKTQYTGRTCLTDVSLPPNVIPIERYRRGNSAG